MPESEPLVDIHCHLLPGIDDGAADWDESLAMARMAVADGITAVVATPHQLGTHRQNHGQAIRDRTTRFQQQLDRHRVCLQVLPGADVRIEPDMIERIRTGDVLTLADRGRYVLLELPHGIYVPLDGLVRSLQRAGLVGILSHPERNAGILRQPGLVEPLVDAGCLLQITGGSLSGRFGPEVQRLAERLVGGGLAHFIASDAHSTRLRRPLLRRAFDRVVKLAGHETACELCCRNPAAVILDGNVVSGRRGAKRSGLAGWFRRNRAG